MRQSPLIDHGRGSADAASGPSRLVVVRSARFGFATEPWGEANWTAHDLR